MYHQIYSEWFPSSGYVQSEGPCMEKCFKDYIEIWIPITKVILKNLTLIIEGKLNND